MDVVSGVPGVLVFMGMARSTGIADQDCAHATAGKKIASKMSSCFFIVLTDNYSTVAVKPVGGCGNVTDDAE